MNGRRRKRTHLCIGGVRRVLCVGVARGVLDEELGCSVFEQELRGRGGEKCDVGVGLAAKEGRRGSEVEVVAPLAGGELLDGGRDVGGERPRLFDCFPMVAASVREGAIETE